MSLEVTNALIQTNLVNVLYGVGEQYNVGVWNGTGWNNLGFLGGSFWTRQIAYDLSGQMWCVGELFDVGIYDPSTGQMDKRGHIGGWHLLCLAFDIDGNMYGVGNQYNVGKWNGSGWDNLGFLGGWWLRYLTFDNQGRMWGVGNQYNVGLWDERTQQWENKGHLGGWWIISLAFDENGDMYGVGDQYNVGKWNGSGWDSLGFLGGWWIRQLTFKRPMKVISVDYHMEEMIVKRMPGQVGNSKDYTNNTSVSQTQTFSYSKTVTNTSTFEWQNATEVGTEMSASVGVPLVGSADVTISASNTFTFGESHANSTEEKFEWIDPITVPPHTKVVAFAELSQGDIEVPFTATVEFMGQTAKRQGTYRGKNFFNARTVVNEYPL